MHLPGVLGALLLLGTVESGFYDYDNEVYDYYRGESSNNAIIKPYRCEVEGFHEDPNDCRAFYRCVDYGNGAPLAPFKFECGPGTVFSEARGSVCVRAADSGRQECCEPANEPDYGDGWTRQAQAQRPSYPATSQQPATRTPRPSYGPTQRPQEPNADGCAGGCANSPGCSQEGFFPNPDDCRKFYRCVNQETHLRRHDFTCGSGTAWDQRLQTCNHEHQVASCAAAAAAGGHPSSPTPPTSQSQQPPQSPSYPSQRPPSSTKGPEYVPPASSPYPGSTAGTQAPGTGGRPCPPTGSSADCKEEGFFPNPRDCHGFFRCVNEADSFRKYDFECGTGTAWDQQLQTCNYEEAAGCASSGVSPAGSRTTSGQQPGSTPTAQSSQSTARPYPGAGSSEPAASTPLGPAQPSSTSGYHPSTPLPRQPTTQRPGPGSTQAARTPQQTVPPSESQSTSGPAQAPSSSSGACQAEGFFPHPSDCRKFVRCVSDPPSYIEYEFDCAPGTAWDQNLLTCNYVRLVASCDASQNEIEPNRPASSGGRPPSGSTPAGTRAPLEENQTEPSQGSTTSSDGPGQANKPADCNPPKKNTAIACETAGFYPHPSRCDKFYRCVENAKGFNVYYFDCPPGTIFDPSIDACNYPESVYPARDCENSQGARPAPTSSTTQKPAPSSEATSAQPESTTGESSEATTEESTESSSEAAATTPSSEATTTPPGASEETTTTTTMSSEGTTAESDSTTTMGSTTPSGETSTSAGSSEATTTSAPENQQSTISPSQETTTAMTGEPQESTTPGSSEEPPPSVDNCPSLANLTDEQVVLVCPTGFRRHPKLCNLFYQCTSSGNMEIKILVLRCPDGTIFDRKENKCLAEADSSEPCMGAIAGKRKRRVAAGDPSPVIEVSTKPLCPDQGHFPYRDGCSNVFYKCKRDTRSTLQGYLYKCPKDFVYWSVSRRCERASRLPMCARMSNQTEFENEAWENRWEIPVEDRNLSARSLLF